MTEPLVSPARAHELTGLGADALWVEYLTLGGSRPREEFLAWLAGSGPGGGAGSGPGGGAGSDRGLDEFEGRVAARALDVVLAARGLPHRVHVAR